MMKTRTKRLLPLILLCIAVFALALTASAKNYSGTCGDNLTYTLDTDTGVLAISGTGAMTNWWSCQAPWYANRYSICTVQISKAVTSIGKSAFQDCSSLTSITIPDSVTSIGNAAFSCCSSLTSITIPGSMTSIGRYAFHDCSGLNAVYITDLAAWCKISFDYDANPLVYAHNLYLNGELVTDLVIPDSVTSIGDSTFYGCNSLTSIIIPDSVTSIGYCVFYNCSSLTSITIPDSVTSIGYSAFYNCSSLTSITIPSRVTSIGESAFDNCFRLNAVYITDLAAWCRISFGDVYANPLHYAYKLYLNGGLVTDAIVPDSVTSIRAYAFAGCHGLKSITIPDSVTSIGQYAFYNCSGLTSITILNLDCQIFNSGSTIPSTAAICGYDGSTAEAYAARYNREFISLGHVHIYADDYTVDVPATCTVDGKKSRHCTGEGCTATIDNIVIPAGHTFGEWKVRTPAKCEETGVDYHICLVCQHEETRTTDKLGHDYATTWTVDTPAKCATPGSKSHHCTRCDAITDVTEIPATGAHKFAETFTIDVPATCTAVGSKSRHCTVCDAKTDITEIPKTAHTYVDGICKECGKAKPPFIPGVVTGEGEKPAKKDLLRLQKYLAGWDVKIDEAVADCNGDGKITKADLLRLQKYLAGWDVTLGG